MFKPGPKRSCHECACLFTFDDGSGICYPDDPDAPHTSYEMTAEEINTPEVCDFWRKRRVMNYEDILNMLKGKNYTTAYNTWYHDDPMKEFIDDSIRSIWHSDGKHEIIAKEEKKNVKTESEVCSSGQYPDDGCIYW